jgi:hypothetical protein
MLARGLDYRRVIRDIWVVVEISSLPSSVLYVLYLRVAGRCATSAPLV